MEKQSAASFLRGAPAIVAFATMALGANAQTTFADEFSSSTLDPAWQLHAGTGQYSLTDHPGYLRYSFAGATNPYDTPALWVYRPFTGDNWVLDSRVQYTMPSGQGRQQIIRLLFGGLEARGVNEVRWVRTHDLGSGFIQGIYNDGGVGDGVLASLYGNDTYFFRIERHGQSVAISRSHDGVSYDTILSRVFSTPLPTNQILSISGANFNAIDTGSADYDYFRLSPVPEPTSISAIGIGIAALAVYRWLSAGRTP